MRILLVGETNVQGRDRPETALAGARALLDQADLRLVHAEGMFTPDAGRGTPGDLVYKERWRHAPPEMIRAFTAAGCDGLSMASNVAADRTAVGHTIEIAADAGVGVCGIGRDLAEARRPLILERAGRRVALLSRTCVFWPHIVPATDSLAGAATVKAHTAYQPGRRVVEMPGAPPAIVTWPDADELAALIDDVAAARQAADLVLLSMHWGVSGSHGVLAYQRAVAHAAIDAGADLVFGHHPHVVCPVERHGGRLIFYSLGNFAFDWPKMRGRHREGCALIFDVDAASIRCRAVPVQRDATNNVRPVPADDPAWAKVHHDLADAPDPALAANIVPDGDGLIVEL